MKQLRDDLYGIRGWFGWVHLLVEGGELALVDTGFVGDFQRIQQAIAKLGFPPTALKVILLTHGHIDHTSNAARLQEWSGARVYAPAGDEQHVEGRYPYRGASRICGGLEVVGRLLTRYQLPRVDVWYRPGDELPVWGGLRIVALPGHTAGHGGFYSSPKRVLFAGDLFANFWRIAQPPAFFSTDPKQARVSMKTAALLDMEWIIPCHYCRVSSADVAGFKERAARL